jgi:hypothetical protein
MNNWSIFATAKATLLALIFVLALDIGGAGTILAVGAANAHGAHIHILAGP